MKKESKKKTNKKRKKDRTKQKRKIYVDRKKCKKERKN